MNLEACDICPRLCGVNRAAGERGYCGADASLVIARAALHFWEEPPISGESGSGTVFFSHCPLRCVYCQNAVIARGDMGVAVSVDRLADICFELQAKGAMNVNFVTPTHYAPLVREAVIIARSRGLRVPIVWNTGGYERAETIRSLDGMVDVYLTDFKYACAPTAQCYSQAPDYPQRALEALDAMVAQVGAAVFDDFEGVERMVRGVVVRHLILPSRLDESKAAIAMLHARYGDDVLLSIMNQYTPVLSAAAESGDVASSQALTRFPELAERVSEEEYEELLDFADALGVKDYFWQKGGACEESFIPAFDLTGVL